MDLDYSELAREMLDKLSSNYTQETDFPVESLDTSVEMNNQTSPRICDLDDYTMDPENGTLCYIPYSMRPETYIVPAVFAIIFIIGVLGNGTLIFIFLKHKSIRNVPNMYIVSLAVGDLCVILFCVPFTSTLYTIDSWPYGEFVCKFSEFIKDLSIGVSVFTLTALSADRYLAIKDPMRKLHGRRATRITYITILGIWLLSVAFALPSAVFSFVRVIDGDPHDPSRVLYVCYPFPSHLGDKYPQFMVMFHFLAYYTVPLFLIATFYIIMARHLVLSTKNMPGEAQGQARQIHARRKVAKMILCFVVIFAVCFFPSHLFMLWFYFYPNAVDHFNEFWNACRIIGFCFSFLNSCVNPITLYSVSGTFRKKYNEELFCCFCDGEGKTRGNKRRPRILVCGCVSLSGTVPSGHLYASGDSRFRNGCVGSHGLHRTSTATTNTHSLNNSMMKRKSNVDSMHAIVSPHKAYNNPDDQISLPECNPKLQKEGSSKSPFDQPFLARPAGLPSSEHEDEFAAVDGEHRFTNASSPLMCKVDADIISGIQCDCKASLVQKISLQNKSTYD